MNAYSISIYLEDRLSIYDLLKQINSQSDLSNCKELTINIDYTCGDFMYSEIYVAIVAFIKYLEKRGIKTNIIFDTNQDCDTVRYASRINFFEIIGIEFNEEFERWDSDNNFIEITYFDKENSDDLVQKVVDCFYKNYDVDDFIDIIDYSAWELNDNVIRHSKKDDEEGGYGYIYIQNYQDRIKLTIADTGVGIYESLSKSDAYSDLSEKECIEKCIEKGVTCGRGGHGRGLFDISEFVRKNRGILQIFSGNSYLYLTDQKINLTDCAYWQGTIIVATFHKRYPFNIKDVTNTSTYKELLESRAENQTKIDELW